MTDGSSSYSAYEMQMEENEASRCTFEDYSESSDSDEVDIEGVDYECDQTEAMKIFREIKEEPLIEDDQFGIIDVARLLAKEVNEFTTFGEVQKLTHRKKRKRNHIVIPANPVTDDIDYEYTQHILEQCKSEDNDDEDDEAYIMAVTKMGGESSRHSHSHGHAQVHSYARSHPYSHGHSHPHSHSSNPYSKRQRRESTSDDDSEPKARLCHNSNERARRCEARKLLTNLRDIVPNTEGHYRASKIEILRQAANYCHQLTETDKRLEMERDAIRQHGLILRQELSMIRRKFYS